MSKYLVIYERGPKNWSAFVPDLPGWIATAKTKRGLEKLMREAIELHLAGLRRHGMMVPKPCTEAGLVAVA